MPTSTPSNLLIVPRAHSEPMDKDGHTEQSPTPSMLVIKNEAQPLDIPKHVVLAFKLKYDDTSTSPDDKVLSMNDFIGLILNLCGPSSLNVNRFSEGNAINDCNYVENVPYVEIESITVNGYNLTS
jgi:hypothetical protein